MALAGLFALALFAGSSAAASAAMPPHVPDGSPTDSCSMCHRAHTADTVVPRHTTETTETTGTSLVLSTDPARGDIALCVTCHGVGQLGSNSDVESEFSRSSVHSLAPSSAPYGPGPLYCSTCHDAHGSDRTAGGAPYAALLRAYSLDSTRAVLAGEGYCAACHTVQPGESWNGLDVFSATAHYSGIAAPPSGTGIRCSVCHASHGSDVAPLLVGSLVPASASTTFTVTADDRTFCVACHPVARATWPGEETYAASAHALSSKTVTITARWVPAGQRKVGECQVCHAAMGRSDGSEGAVPKLLDAQGRALCDRCHSVGGVASTDTSSQARPSVNARELAIVYSPATSTASAGRMAVYGRASSGSGPLSGPREYRVAGGTGPSAAGDIDGDGDTELVVASPDSPTLTVLRTDALTGRPSNPTIYAIPAGSRAMELRIANVVDTAPAPGYYDRPEIVIVTAGGEFGLYDWSGSVLQTVAGPSPIGTGPWDLAIGDVTGTPLPDAVVTDRDGGALFAFTDDTAQGVTSSVWAIGGSPVAPSIGKLWDAPSGVAQVAVCDASSTTETVRLFTGSGTLLASYAVATGAGRPVASAVGDVVWSAPVADRAELAVAFAQASGDSTIVVVPQAPVAFGLDAAAAVELSTGTGSRTGSLLVADVDDDGRDELVAGDGGTWARDASAQAPGLRIFGAAAAADLASSLERHLAGGAELAGGVPSLVFADLGPVFPSRHPVDAGSAAHVSTETAPFDRHVTCADCHDSHEAVVAETVAPAVQGLLRGAWGVSVAGYGGGVPSFDAPARSATGYGVCYRCHSSYTALGGRPDVAAQFDPDNASVHAVQAASRTSDVASATFETALRAWTPDSVLYCTDCHGDSGGGAQSRDLHESGAAPILGRPYLGTAPDSESLLCYSCHRRGVYATGVDDGPGMSSFVTAGGAKRLHSVHVDRPMSGGHGLSCSACHVSHGSATQPHLLRSDIGFAAGAPHAGACTAACHDPAVDGGTRTFDANAPSDTMAPTGVMSVDQGAAYVTSTDASVDCTVTDAGSGLGQMRIDPGTGSYGAWTTYAASSPIVLPTGDGVQTVRAQYRDGVGNTLTLTDTIELDTAPPLTTSDAAPAYSGPAEVTLSATDGGSGLRQTYYRVDSGGRQTGSAVLIAPPVLGSASHTVYYWSMDNAGNSEPEKSATFLVSSSFAGPVATAYVDNGPYTYDEAIVELAAAAQSGPVYTAYTLDGWDDEYSYDGPFQVYGTGEHTLTFWSWDSFGNSEAPHAVTFTVLPPAPAIDDRHEVRVQVLDGGAPAEGLEMVLCKTGDPDNDYASWNWGWHILTDADGYAVWPDVPGRPGGYRVRTVGYNQKAFFYELMPDYVGPAAERPLDIQNPSDTAYLNVTVRDAGGSAVEGATVWAEFADGTVAQGGDFSGTDATGATDAGGSALLDTTPTHQALTVHVRDAAGNEASGGEVHVDYGGKAVDVELTVGP